MDQSIALIAFDLGGVFVDVDKTRAASHLGISNSRAEDAFFRNRFFDSFVLGKISASDYFAEASSKLALSPQMLENAFRQIVQPKTLCDQIIPKLRKPFTIWSNINMCHYKHVCRLAPVLRSGINGRGLSFEIGAVKPTPHFFEECLGDLKVKPSSILFLDDTMAHVQAARRFGIRAEVVQNENAIHHVLQSANLL